MDRFGYKNMFHSLSGNKIHHLDNILTSEPSIHDLFDRLDIWFEPTVSIMLFSPYRGLLGLKEQHEYGIAVIHPPALDRWTILAHVA